MLLLLTYKGLAGLPFGSTEATVIESLGPPTSRGTNYSGELEYLYSGFILRYDASSRLFREITVLPNHSASVNGNDIEWTPRLLDWLRQQDCDLQEVHGFVVSLQLGMAVTGFHDGDAAGQAVHLFRRGDFDRFRARMKSFRWPREASIT